MKKIILGILLAGLILLAIGAWLIIGPATSFDQKTAYLEIPTGSNYTQVMEIIQSKNLLKHPATFDFLAKRLDYDEKVKAGRYSISKNNNLLNFIRKLKNGQQDPVNLVITKLRTKEDFASLAGRKFEFDSASFIRFLNNNDSLQNLDSIPIPS